MLAKHVWGHGFNPQLNPKTNRNRKWQMLADVKIRLSLSNTLQLNNSIKTSCKKVKCAYIRNCLHLITLFIVNTYKLLEIIWKVRSLNIFANIQKKKTSILLNEQYPWAGEVERKSEQGLALGANWLTHEWQTHSSVKVRSQKQNPISVHTSSFFSGKEKE